MIAYTIDQAAERVTQPAHVIHGWVTAGILIAVRNPIDGHLYVEEEHLLDVDRDTYRASTGTATAVQQARPDPMPLPALSQWLTNHGYPTTVRALRRWAEGGWLTPTLPGSKGRGKAALYDSIDAIAIAEGKNLRITRPAGPGIPAPC
jgi:hypothetical protein